MERILLICNAHIDPVWLWKMEEGLGAAITTFSQAADFLEEYDGFVFNHNESLLYEYVEQVAPSLFKRIKELVACGRWHIMGGWFLQPDANIPCGESMLRQIIRGREYFLEKFGSFPEIAVNFDSFGHSRGLVQILAKTGYKGFVCCRPLEEMKERMFLWNGFDNTQVKLYRAVDGYCTLMGQLKNRLESYAEYFTDFKTQALFWGVGNHGGGASRADLDSIANFEVAHPGIRVEHSDPESFFEAYCADGHKLPVYEGSIKDVFPGCYTSQHKVKQLHQRLENDLYVTEKMCLHASLFKFIYPEEKLREAERCLLICEFHDILPGTTIKEGEEYAIRKLNCGLAILEEIRNRAFIALTAGQPRAREGEYPIFVYNPHPFPIRKTIECELNLADQNWNETINLPDLRLGDREVPCQLEKESANLNLDWRKKVVFTAELQPFTMNRFSCFMHQEPLRENCSGWNYRTAFAEAEAFFPKAGGILENVRRGSEELFDAPIRVAVYDYCGDPWGFDYNSFNRKLGEFRPMNTAELRAYLNDERASESIRVVENGEVRTVIESYLIYGATTLRFLIYADRSDGTLQFEYELNNSEKDKIFRIELQPAADGRLESGTCFGLDQPEANGKEQFAQDYLLYEAGSKSFGIIHFGNYGFRFDGKMLSLTLAHFPAYAGHPVAGRPLLKDHRYTERLDQGITTGKYLFVFEEEERLRQTIARVNAVHKQSVDALNFFPVKTEGDISCLLEIENSAVICMALFRQGARIWLRLFNSSYRDVESNISSRLLGFSEIVSLNAFAFATYCVEAGRLTEVDLTKRENY